MFSYRHAFHAGNHADVLKHTALIAILKHMVLKETPLAVFDTHAGAGLYRLDGDYALTSGEAEEGYLRLSATGHSAATHPAQNTTPEALQDYLDMVASFNSKQNRNVYPGSPFIIQRLLRPQDKLRLFELHPTDSKALSGNIAQLEAGRQVTVYKEDGFGSLKKHLPPPQRRALVLMDPSYELKPDYGQVVQSVADALHRFATGTYMVWYPIIPRPEAHDLPRKLKTMAVGAGKGWLNATLTLKSSRTAGSAVAPEQRPGLPASGVFVINPPFTLEAALRSALPYVANALAQGRHAAHSVEAAPAKKGA